LAFKGTPREIIQEILEHDSPESANAYIDATHTEIAKAINKVDRNIGNIFRELNDAYFRGTISTRLNTRKIMMPNNSQALILGSCKRDLKSDGHCSRHPFLQCYGGCPNFQAWRLGDHRKALQYVDQEIRRMKKMHLRNDDLMGQLIQSRNAIREVLKSIGQT
jgi:hypothetical protein